MSKSKKFKKKEIADNKNYSRRDFLARSATLISAGTIASALPAISKAEETKTTADKEYKKEIPLSKGYLVYDSKKCIGCTTCMLSCSMVHYGVQSLSLARIQIIQDSFGKFPEDLQIAPCRQCPAAPCVQNCPVGAAYVDTKNGNVRRIDEDKCIGCQTCLSACPYQPHRPVWNHISGKATKCDLCIDTPYWDEKGGIDGKQACVESCPMKALKLVNELPDQKKAEGYNVNLRNQYWYALGLRDVS
jgi:protein NrfC